MARRPEALPANVIYNHPGLDGIRSVEKPYNILYAPRILSTSGWLQAQHTCKFKACQATALTRTLKTGLAGAFPILYIYIYTCMLYFAIYIHHISLSPCGYIYIYMYYVCMCTCYFFMQPWHRPVATQHLSEDFAAQYCGITGSPGKKIIT